jgi:hypothetical protein
MAWYEALLAGLAAWLGIAVSIAFVFVLLHRARD